MTPIMLRQLWSLIENTQADLILQQDDSSLVNWLLAKLREVRSLEGEESQAISHYLQTKTSLIRDLAAQR
ncbi:hypothetical protein K4A83_14625 [Spirulina subsalsa FACHB-351]|uniref:Uncharacterized protein n=1 Tax=Spirulina subsalsa FACHB-351 TaxID=234711 RepID=A0ABT3L7M7_9CYAN|nr:hypothetical protein [Spirulina subsalsa]MCW6037499.1 hypothetical protein [Spirulina subsalsa FACHB-351]